MTSPADTARYTGALIRLTVVCYLGLLAWPDFMSAIGAGHAGIWFLDINTLLASNDAVALMVNMSLDFIPSARIRPLLDGLILAIHVMDWLWVALWLLGLGGVMRFICQRWAPGVAPVAPVLARSD